MLKNAGGKSEYTSEYWKIKLKLTSAYKHVLHLSCKFY